jgi:hypothetical protein
MSVSDAISNCELVPAGSDAAACRGFADVALCSHSVNQGQPLQLKYWMSQGAAFYQAVHYETAMRSFYCCDECHIKCRAGMAIATCS